MGSEDKITETLITVKSMSKWEKILGSSMLAVFVGGVVWVTLTNKTVAEHTIAIDKNNKEIQSIRDTLPLIHIHQAVNVEVVKNLQKDVTDIKSNQEKDRMMMISMLEKVSYLYDKRKEKE